MGQSIQTITGKDFSDLLKTLKMEAKFAYNHGSIVSSLSCAAHSRAPFGMEIHAIVVYSEGASEQVFKHLSANSLQDLNYNIDFLAEQMAKQNYEIASIAHSAIPASKAHTTAEAIVVFNHR